VLIVLNDVTSCTRGCQNAARESHTARSHPWRVSPKLPVKITFRQFTWTAGWPRTAIWVILYTKGDWPVVFRGPELYILLMHGSHLSCPLRCGSWRASSCHFRLPPRWKWDLRSSGMLCSPDHSSWTDIPLKMGPIGCSETSESSRSAQFYVTIEVISDHASYRNFKPLVWIKKTN